MSDSQPVFDTNALPIAQLESLRFKTTQLIESVQSLQWLLGPNQHTFIPAWPDILSKYSLLLSQTHGLSNALLNPNITATSVLGGKAAAELGNPYERIALHPRMAMSETQLDNEISPLLRNNQTNDVLEAESATVRRVANHMFTRGSIGVLGGVPLPTSTGIMSARKPEHEDVIAECSQIQGDHDRRVERAVRAVTMLKERYEWKTRVAVDVEEPENLDFDPRFAGGQTQREKQPEQDVEMGSSDSDEDDSSDEDEIQNSLIGDGTNMHTPVAHDTPTANDTPMTLDTTATQATADISVPATTGTDENTAGTA